MDSEQTEINSVKEMEEARKIPGNPNQGRLYSQGCTQSLDQDGSLAICNETGSTFCYEPRVVQRAWTFVPARLYSRFFSILNGSVTDRRAVYLAGTYRSVGRGWLTSYFLPDTVMEIDGFYGIPWSMEVTITMLKSMGRICGCYWPENVVDCISS